MVAEHESIPLGKSSDIIQIQIEDLLDCSRYGELDDISAYVNEMQSMRAFPSPSDKHRVDFLGMKGSGGRTMLHMASANGHYDLVKYIIDHISQPVRDHLNVRNDEGNTPLHWACMNGHAKVAELLISHGADGKISNEGGHTCLFYAQDGGKEDVVDVLLRMVNYEDDASDDDEEGIEEEENSR